LSHIQAFFEQIKKKGLRRDRSVFLS